MRKLNQRGITLIALVVTIIVLIILAGISISLLFGENGIISKAKDAREAFLRSANEEEIELADIDRQIDNYIEGIPGGVENNNNNIPTTITSAIGAPVNTAEYGTRVLNYTAANLVWRLFYEDANNVYLISETSSKGYPLNDVELCELDGNWPDAPKSDAYASGACVSNEGKALMPLLGGATSSSAGTVALGTNENGINLLTANNTNPSIWETAYLCDTSANGPWASYKTNQASWAMGGPTIELFVASYNATHSSRQITLGIEDDGYTENTPTYFFSTSDRNGIYRLTSSGFWWIAGPNHGTSYWTYSLNDYLGCIHPGNPQDGSISARPVVCLSKSNFVCEFDN